MDHTRRLAIAGLMTGLFVISVLAFVTLKPATFDYSKVRSENGLNDGILIRKSVDSALSDFTTKEFLIKYDNPKMAAFVYHVSPYEVSQMKAMKPETSSLPDKTLIGVQFDPAGDNSIPERPKLFLYLDPQTYNVYGAYKLGW